MGFTFGKIKAVLMGAFSGTDTKVAVDTDGHLQVDVVLLGHASSHEDGNADEIDCAGLDGRVNFVDRGQRAGYDFVKEDLTMDSSWYELDLSSIIPVGTKQVMVNVLCKNSSAQKYIHFRTPGVTNEFTSPSIFTLVANLYHEAQVPVVPDGDRKIEYYVQSATWSHVNIIILSWLV